MVDGFISVTAVWTGGGRDRYLDGDFQAQLRVTDDYVDVSDSSLRLDRRRCPGCGRQLARMRRCNF